jgi:leader peptidase (prepilin peptidase)/N-methyltransferase
MIRILGTVFAGLLGLAFGSFLNVCVSRWPKGESVVHPRSHCRNCGRTLKWWENVPLVSWLALRGSCRTCGARISWRYVVVETAVGVLWAIVVWRALGPQIFGDTVHPYHLSELSPPVVLYEVTLAVGMMLLLWLLIALATLDVEYFWLPDRLTLPGIGLGVALGIGWLFALIGLANSAEMLPPEPLALSSYGIYHHLFPHLDLASRAVLNLVIDPVIAAALILLIRWLYKLIRRREGLGLGDVKLMAMLAAWLGLPGALLSFFLGVVLGAIVAVIALARGKASSMTKLPLGTFLCIGGIVSALWGQQIIAAYLRWSGF